MTTVRDIRITSSRNDPTRRKRKPPVHREIPSDRVAKEHHQWTFRASSCALAVARTGSTHDSTTNRNGKPEPALVDQFPRTLVRLWPLDVSILENNKGKSASSVLPCWDLFAYGYAVSRVRFRSFSRLPSVIETRRSGPSCVNRRIRLFVVYIHNIYIYMDVIGNDPRLMEECASASLGTVYVHISANSARDPSQVFFFQRKGAKFNFLKDYFRASSRLQRDNPLAWKEIFLFARILRRDRTNGSYPSNDLIFERNLDLSVLLIFVSQRTPVL